MQLVGGRGVRGRERQDIRRFDREGYRIEKIVYESLPGFYVTANVYVPTRGAGRFRRAAAGGTQREWQGRGGRWPWGSCSKASSRA